MPLDETLESLIQYCCEYNRICPMPVYWNQLWGKLKGRKRIGLGWEPPVPLILGAWWHTSDHMKQARLIEHLRWAEKEGQLDEISIYLHGLKEQNWFHIND